MRGRPAATRTPHQPSVPACRRVRMEPVPVHAGGLVSSSAVSVRRLSAAALAAAAVIGAVALPASAADHARPHQPRVEISAVQYDSPGRDDRSRRSLNREWVELTNTTRHSVNLDGWRLSAEDGRTYTFDHYRLDARATVRIHTGEGRDTRTDLFQDRRHYAWDNHSDTATLRNDRGRFVDDASWGNDRHDHGDRGPRPPPPRRPRRPRPRPPPPRRPRWPPPLTRQRACPAELNTPPAHSRNAPPRPGPSRPGRAAACDHPCADHRPGHLVPTPGPAVDVHSAHSPDSRCAVNRDSACGVR